MALARPVPTVADTIEAALVRAYQNNPQLNAQRALMRSTDENVPQALSNYRPKVALTANGSYQYTDFNTTSSGTPTSILRREYNGTDAPRSAGLTVTQTLFNGNQTANKTRAAESQVSGAREALRVIEETVLLSAATIYMDYLRDAAIFEVQRSNVRVLEQTLKQTRDRFAVGTVTPTDVAQAQAQLAAGQSQQITAEANLVTTRSNFRRIIGNEPSNLAPGSPVDRFLPKSSISAVELSLIENPNVTAAMFGIDVNYLQVKINEGALLPIISLQTSVQQAYEQTLTTFRAFGASTVAQLSVPVYQGGAEYSLIRQSKGNPGAAAPQSRNDPRPDPRQHSHGMGAAGGGQGGGNLRRIAGGRVGNRAHRRSPGGRRRTTDDARRAERAAGVGQCARRARHRAARPCGRVLCGTKRRRSIVAAGSQSADN
jgi:outer membrane protein